MGGPCRIAAQTEVGAAKLPKYCCGPPGLLSRLHMVTSPRHIQKERFARPFLFRSFLLMKYKIRCVKLLLVRTIRTSISKQLLTAVIEVTALDLPWGVMQYPPPPPIPSPKFVPPTTQNTARVWKADPQRGCRVSVPDIPFVNEGRWQASSRR